MSIPIRIQRGVNTKEEKLHQQIFNSIFQNDIKKSLKINKLNINLNTGITKDPYFIFPVLYSTDEPVHILGFFPPGSEYRSRRHFFKRIRNQTLIKNFFKTFSGKR